MTRWAAVTAVVLLCAVARAAGPAADAERVQADIRKLLDATYTGDVDTVMALTNPALIEQFESREAARRTYVEAMERVKKIGMKIEDFEFPAPPSFVEGNGRLYAIVPTRVVVSAGGRRVDGRGFQVGVGDRIEDRWTYVEGAKFDASLRAKYFADFPADYELPATPKLDTVP